MIELLDWFAAHEDFAVMAVLCFLLPIYWATRIRTGREYR